MLKGKTTITRDNLETIMSISNETFAEIEKELNYKSLQMKEKYPLSYFKEKTSNYIFLLMIFIKLQ